MKVAVQGCCHGELDNIYATILASPERPDVLLCCGDFQSFRNPADLHTFAAPQKYRQLGDFWRYYNGEKEAPVLTIFVGGNHEASAYLQELYHGGFVAPNIYFLGIAGSVLLRKQSPGSSEYEEVRIAGASGIFKSHDYRTGHFEKLPYDNSTLRSVYHIREFDVFRLAHLVSPLTSTSSPAASSSSTRPDVFFSHDWPQGIEQAGDIGSLLRRKPFFRQEVQTNSLGSPPLLHLLRTLKPPYWFSAHLHVKFPAIWKHDFDQRGLAAQAAAGKANGGAAAVMKNPDEVEIDADDSEEEAVETVKPEVKNADEIIIDDDDDDDDGADAGVPRTNGALEPATNGAADVPGPGPPASVDESVDRLAEQAKEASPSATALGKRKAEASPEQDRQAANGADVTIVEAAAATEPAGGSVVEVSSGPASGGETGLETRFLALDKCLPGRGFLQILDVKPSAKPGPSTSAPAPQSDEAAPEAVVTMHYDPRWLAITRAFQPFFPQSKHPSSNPRLPSDPAVVEGMIEKELEWVQENVPDRGEGMVGEVESVEGEENGVGFVKTAKAVGEEGGDDKGQPSTYRNPQTVAFCKMLGIEDKVSPLPAPA